MKEKISEDLLKKFDYRKYPVPTINPIASEFWQKKIELVNRQDGPFLYIDLFIYDYSDFKIPAEKIGYQFSSQLVDNKGRTFNIETVQWKDGDPEELLKEVDKFFIKFFVLSCI